MPICVLWNAFTGEHLTRCKGHTSTITNLQRSPDGKFLVASSADTTVSVWQGV